MDTDAEDRPWWRRWWRRYVVDDMPLAMDDERMRWARPYDQDADDGPPQA